MISSFEDEMISYINGFIMEHLPKDPFEQDFLPSRYDTIIGIFTCFDQHQNLMEFLIRTNFNTSFRQKLQEKLFQILDSLLSEH